jgi:hypothetical protein
VKKNIEENTKGEIGLVEALAVARGDTIPAFGAGDAKLLAFLLREGECDVEITKTTIYVWYSWLQRFKPSRYFIQLAPGLVGRLMQLGGMESITTDAAFSVGPCSVKLMDRPIACMKKWVRIQLEESRIYIRVRDKQPDLNKVRFQYLEKAAYCERCNKELRTPFAKQCLHCGYDLH